MLCDFCNQPSCNCEQLIVNISDSGRLCNRLIRNMAVSFLAERIDLYLKYPSYDKFKQLGIPLYIGKKLYPQTIYVNDSNYFEILQNTPYMNINPGNNFFQTREISQIIYNKLHEEPIKNEIILKNPYKERYNLNNDCFVHVRLGDIMTYYNNHFGLKYYLKAINRVGNFDRLYVSSDTPDHEIIQGILDAYPERSGRVLLDEVETIQFGSTCRNIVLSHGTYSAVIGWLGYYSNIYYPECIPSKMWFGDIFSVNPEWNKIVDCL